MCIRDRFVGGCGFFGGAAGDSDFGGLCEERTVLCGDGGGCEEWCGDSLLDFCPGVHEMSVHASCHELCDERGGCAGAEVVGEACEDGVRAGGEGRFEGADRGVG